MKETLPSLHWPQTNSIRVHPVPNPDSEAKSLPPPRQRSPDPDLFPRPEKANHNHIPYYKYNSKPLPYLPQQALTLAWDSQQSGSNGATLALIPFSSAGLLLQC